MFILSKLYASKKLYFILLLLLNLGAVKNAHAEVANFNIKTVDGIEFHSDNLLWLDNLKLLAPESIRNNRVNLILRGDESTLDSVESDAKLLIRNAIQRDIVHRKSNFLIKNEDSSRRPTKNKESGACTKVRP